MLTTVKQDIIALMQQLTAQSDTQDNMVVVIHQCNCFNNMGAGIAKVLADHYPAVAHADRATQKGSKDKLGDFSYALLAPKLAVVNLYSQYAYGGAGIDGTGRNTDYDAMQKGFDKIVTLFEHTHPLFVMPKHIGSGLAKGDMATIHRMIEKTFADYPVIFVEL